MMARIFAKRRMEHLERAGFVVIKRPPIGESAPPHRCRRSNINFPHLRANVPLQAHFAPQPAPAIVFKPPPPVGAFFHLWRDVLAGSQGRIELGVDRQCLSLKFEAVDGAHTALCFRATLVAKRRY